MLFSLRAFITEYTKHNDNAGAVCPAGSLRFLCERRCLFVNFIHFASRDDPRPGSRRNTRKHSERNEVTT